MTKLFTPDKEVYNDSILTEYLEKEFKPGWKSRVLERDPDTGKVKFDFGPNLTVLGGSLATLENFFRLTPNPTQHLNLNQIMTIPHSVDVLSSDPYGRSIGYFMIGNGAENVNVNYAIYSPHKWETKLYNAVPFRCVPITADLSPDEKQYYRLRKLITIGTDQYYAYYAKKFDITPLNLLFNEANYSPLEAHSAPVQGDGTGHPMSGGSLVSFVKMTLTVSKTEFKEWYRLTNNNSLVGARLSEIGLVYGKDAPNTLNGGALELAGAELFAKLTHSAIPMDTEGSRRSVDYLVYS